MMDHSQKRDILAPAKINLALSVTGRLDNGYHLLDSIVAFADIGDRIIIEPGAGFSFHVKGPYARAFTAQDLDSGRESANLAVQAAWGMAEAAERDLDCRITLHKNLPLASGLGGGSADAAAVMWGLMEMWRLKPASLPWLNALALSIGADVPVCLACRPMRMTGIGDGLEALPPLPEMPVLLVNPGLSCPTADVFGRFAGPFGRPLIPPSGFDRVSLLTFLSNHGNDLTAPAVNMVPDIAFVLEDLKAQDGCLLARMCGSGATCFALFADESETMDAAERLTRRHPGWWIRAGMLNRPERY